VADSWRSVAEPSAVLSFGDPAKDLGMLLLRLTVPVVVEQLEREPRFRQSGVSFVEASDRA